MSHHQYWSDNYHLWTYLAHEPQPQYRLAHQRHMTRCLSLCGLDASIIQLNDRSANMTKKCLEAKLHWHICIEEAPETQLGPTKAELPLGFACPDPDDMS